MPSFSSCASREKGTDLFIGADLNQKINLSPLAHYAEGAAEANTGFTERAENLQITAQALLAQVEPQLIFQQGDLTMFVMDMPPDVPPQYAPVVVAQVSQAQQGPEVDRIIGVCHLATNNEELKHSAINGVAPVGAAWGYLNQVETRKVPLSGTMDVLSEPKHGKLEQVHDSKGRHVGYRYLPTSAYVGEDSATFLVEIGGYTVKVIYFFNVMPYVAPGSEEYDPYEDPNLCPKGDVWKISFHPDDPIAPVYTIPYAGTWRAALADATKVTVTFADLPGETLGQTVGNTITLDVDAAGHGWFVDETPWDNSEYVATSNLNAWVAKSDSDAAGKMDLLSVLLHEYGHVLGLTHNDAAHTLIGDGEKGTDSEESPRILSLTH